MMSHFARRVWTLSASLSLYAGPMAAQTPDTTAEAARRVLPLPAIGSGVEDDDRTAQLLSSAPTDGYLVRSPSSRLGRSRSGSTGPDWALVAPELDVTWNSALPFSINDGALWAGRGLNARVVGGAWLRYGPLSVLLAPELRYEQNREIALPGFEGQHRNGASAPWYVGARSADLPLRFGESSRTLLGPGQSSLAVRAGPLSVGGSTEDQWWGPGIRNALVLSNNAPGIPHLFLRTAEPVRTRVGSFEGRWIVGGLRESSFFDTLAANDTRSLSGLALTFRPAFEQGLTLGIARTVQASVDGAGGVPGRALDVLTRWSFPQPEDSVPGDSRSDQVLSVFGRWVLPDDGVEVYAEWARQQLPESFMDLLDRPGASNGYTVGAQGARPLGAAGALRLQVELTYLEQTARTRAVRSFYTSPWVPQGYTHGGQVIGASIGPGSSSQWGALDYLAPRWRLGVFGNRIRWDNDAYLTTPRALYAGWGFLGHDVSLLGGIRGGFAFPGIRVDAELITGTRYNFLYQNRGRSWETADDAEDVRNNTLRLSVTPAAGRRAPARTPVEVPPPPPPAPPAADTAALPDTAGVAVVSPPVDSTRPAPGVPPAGTPDLAPVPIAGDTATGAAVPGMLPAPGGSLPPATGHVTRAGAVVTHVVQAGETLFGIARRYGVSVAALQAANPGTRQDTLQAGQALRIPASGNTAGTDGPHHPRRHLVKSGETLFGIAASYGVKPEAIRAANRLRGDAIRAGQELLIPGPGAP
jgi:LysM repeat protein